MTEYYICKKCNQIEPKELWETQNLTKECNYCSRSEYQRWPSQDIIDLFDHAMMYDPKDDHYSLVTSVFVSTALELLFEDLLILILYIDLNFHETGFVVDLLLDSFQGKSRRLQLYKKYVGISFSKEAIDTGNKNFFNNWERISSIRNKKIHGLDKNQLEISPKFIKTIVSEALDVFYKLHNKYNRETFFFDYYTNKKIAIPKTPSREDIRKLSRWMNRKVDLDE